MLTDNFFGRISLDVLGGCVPACDIPGGIKQEYGVVLNRPDRKWETAQNRNGRRNVAVCHLQLPVEALASCLEKKKSCDRNIAQDSVEARFNEVFVGIARLSNSVRTDSFSANSVNLPELSI